MIYEQGESTLKTVKANVDDQLRIVHEVYDVLEMYLPERPRSVRGMALAFRFGLWPTELTEGALERYARLAMRLLVFESRKLPHQFLRNVGDILWHTWCDLIHDPSCSMNTRLGAIAFGLMLNSELEPEEIDARLLQMESEKLFGMLEAVEILMGHWEDVVWS